MRILKIRFANLNSLVGEWEIDLSKPEFASEGIFAITGPTGAGKTTILDAICLALYGQTPRLGNITKSTNEIMSRQCGECFSEVSFATQKGDYRCFWYQHRSRKKAGESLQTPRHELIKVVDGKKDEILENRLSLIDKQVEEITGLDFKRFTRSILLAQGDFAAFLNAPSGERANILEKITGVDIYTDISMQVYERHSAENKKLESLQQALAGMNLLSPEEETQQNEVLQERLLQEGEQRAKLKEIQGFSAWLEGINRLEKELQQTEIDWGNFLVKQADFQADLNRLQRSNQARELLSGHSELNNLRRLQKEELQSVSDCQGKIQAQTLLKSGAEKDLIVAQTDLAERKAESLRMQAVLQQVRGLDLTIKERQKPLQEAEKALSDLRKQLIELQAKKEKEEKNHIALQKQDEELRLWIAQNQLDEKLVTELAGICTRLDNWQDLQKDSVKKIAGLKKEQKEKERLEKQHADSAEKLELLNRRQKELAESFLNKQTELNAVLAEKSLAEWRKEMLGLRDRGLFWQKALDAEKKLTGLNAKNAQLKTELEKLSISKNDSQKKLAEAQAGSELLERHVAVLEDNLSLVQKIQNFTEARKELRDGEKCPLCGSEEHPFAIGNIPVLTEKRAELQAARKKLGEANKQLQELRLSLSGTEKEIILLERCKKEYLADIAGEKESLSLNLQALDIKQQSDNLLELLRQGQKANGEKLQKQEGALLRAEKLEQELSTLRQQTEKQQKELILTEKRHQALLYDFESCKKTFLRLEEEEKSLTDRLLQIKNNLIQELQLFNVSEAELIEPEKLRLQLNNRQQEWMVRQKKQTELLTQLEKQTQQLQYLREQLLATEEELKKREERWQGLHLEMGQLMAERKELFAAKNPDDEEAFLKQAIEKSEQKKGEIQQKLEAVNQELYSLQSRLQGLEKSTISRAKDLQQAEEKFRLELHKYNFTDEKDYLYALLSNEERELLLKTEQELTREKNTLEGRLQDKKATLTKERVKNLTELSLSQLREQGSELSLKYDELQQEIGAIRQKLRENQLLRQQQAERVEAIERQKVECAKWSKLNLLIGSADGKKYRIFAQGLTFDMVLAHANRHLQKMTDRYLLIRHGLSVKDFLRADMESASTKTGMTNCLTDNIDIRDEKQALDMNIIDNYQAGELRSVKNLSGGESFIVSLSLALGLSGMASRNVRVDSLFLDEGFGSLDEESLDQALETLAGLRQEGKLIGLISHVGALKERISTRIKLMPQSGGNSIIVI